MQGKEDGEKKEGNEGKSALIKWFSELSNKDIAIAGGKGASLAEMYNNKFPVPPGFIITAQAYSYFLEKAGLMNSIKSILEGLDVEETSKLEASAKKIRDLIINANMPKELEEEIVEAYNILDVSRKNLAGASAGALTILRNSHEPPFVAVRSSATAEDLADASFAGQQESFINVKGKTELLQSVKDCFASLFTARAVYYRAKKGFSSEKTQLAVVVQRMIDSEKSGVMFTQNPVKSENTIMIEAVWGLGEGIVSGRIKPDSYIIDGNLSDFKILETKINEKKVAIVRNSSGRNEIVKLIPERAKAQVLTPYEIKRLSQYGKQLEKHYGKPQDIEFAIEGGEVYIVQSRPITTKAISESSKQELEGEALLSGLGASPGVSSGIVKIVLKLEELNKVKKGDVLVTEMTNPDMVVTMQRAAGIVTDEGGITSHAAIVSREMGIPAVVGTGKATKSLKDGMIITVDGNSGRVFAGKMETRLSQVNSVVPTKTKIKVILDLPDFAQRAAMSHARAVGLVRLEGIIAESGKHPLAYVKQKKVKDYIQVLFDGLKKIASPFSEVWVRSSDIRTDEFRHLEGSSEEIEGNPMLGDHGIRFSLRHPEIMKAEMTAIKEVADEFPDKIMGIMFPQVINLSEVKEAKRIAREEVVMPKNVKFGIMVETPAAVQIIEDLCKEGIDFISFGTNDLTQYTLAIDRNNESVQYLYDEMNPAVLNSISHVIRVCKQYGVETSICGQAGSREDMVKFLLKEGIDSISVNADAAEKVSKLVAKVEEMHGSSGSHGNHNNNAEKKQPEVEVMNALMASREKMQVLADEDEEETEEENGETEADRETSKREFDVDEEGVSGILDRLESEIFIAEEKPADKVVESAMVNENDKKDIEEVILKELDEGEKAEDENGEDYSPGISEKGEDIPSLNDAIPVDSSHVENKEEEKEIVLDKENTVLDIF